MFDIGINGSGNKRCFTANGNGERMKRVVDGTHRGTFGFLSQGRRWSVLTFGEPINAVVEKDNIDIQISANGMHQVVAAD